MKGTYRLLKTLGAFCCGLSEENAVKAGDALGKFFWLLVPARRKRLAVANLLRTGLAKDEKEAERIAKASAVRFGPLGVSMFRFPLLTKENISEYVTIRGRKSWMRSRQKERLHTGGYALRQLGSRRGSACALRLSAAFCRDEAEQ